MKTLRLTFSGLVDMLAEVQQGGTDGATMCRAVAIVLTGYYRSPTYTEVFDEVRDMMSAPEVNPGTVAAKLFARYGKPT